MAGLHGILKDPLLSVVMPVYNERDTVESMIKRVLAVPGIRVELIVVDDGSKDGTSDILRTLQKQYPFKLFHKPNGGKGIGAATRVQGSHGRAGRHSGCGYGIFT